LEKYELSANDHIRAELLQAGSKILLSGIHKFINAVWNEEEFSDQLKESIILPAYKKGDETD
jgi:hypothetical protein